ncbi:MAG: YceD family protein [Clostridiales bacterium]|nr:YceD family protein [Clostridiales bacterium]
MKISINRLRDSGKTEFPFSYDLDLHDLECSYDRPFRDPVHVSGVLADRAGILELTLEIEAPVTTQCARCGKEIHFMHRTETKNVVSDQELSNDSDEEIIYLKSDEIELDEIVSSSLLLSMDMVYLCSEDCKGLCSECGADLNLGPCGCKKEIDPRLAKLKDLLEK